VQRLSQCSPPSVLACNLKTATPRQQPASFCFLCSWHANASDPPLVLQLSSTINPTLRAAALPHRWKSSEGWSCAVLWLLYHQLSC